MRMHLEEECGELSTEFTDFTIYLLRVVSVFGKLTAQLPAPLLWERPLKVTICGIEDAYNGLK